MALKHLMPVSSMWPIGPLVHPVVRLFVCLPVSIFCGAPNGSKILLREFEILVWSLRYFFLVLDFVILFRDRFTYEEFEILFFAASYVAGYFLCVARYFLYATGYF